MAERLASQAAKTAGVVEVTAVAGPSRDGKPDHPQRVRFAAANSGQGTYSDPGKLDRYLDPEHQRALSSLTHANAAAQRRRRADRDRRQQVGCANAHARLLTPPARCECVYCQPGLHLEVAQLGGGSGGALCVCGAPAASPGGRCPEHRQVRVVSLDGDPAALPQPAAARDQGLER